MVVPFHGVPSGLPYLASLEPPGRAANGVAEAMVGVSRPGQLVHRRHAASTEAIEGQAARLSEEVESFRSRG
jgi:hypothetical protein